MTNEQASSSEQPNNTIQVVTDVLRQQPEQLKVKNPENQDCHESKLIQAKMQKTKSKFIDLKKFGVKEEEQTLSKSISIKIRSSRQKPIVRDQFGVEEEEKKLPQSTAKMFKKPIIKHPISEHEMRAITGTL